MQPDPVTTTNSRASRPRSLADRLALTVTFALSPPVLLPVLLWIVLYAVGASRSEVAVVVAGSSVLLGMVPVAFLLWMVRTGRARSLNLEDRRPRTIGLAISLASGVLFLLLVSAVAVTGRALVISMMIAYFVTVLLLLAINRHWRISLHTASAGAFVSVLIFVLVLHPGDAARWPTAPTGLVLLSSSAVLLIGWSRCHLRAHTPLQAAAGAVLGLVVPFLTLSGITTV